MEVTNSDYTANVIPTKWESIVIEKVDSRLRGNDNINFNCILKFRLLR